MSIHTKTLRIALLGALMALLAAIPAQAVDFTNVAFVQTAMGTTSIPVGHAEFCRTHANECRAHANPVAAVTLTGALWQQLQAVNSHYNQAIVPVTDHDLYQVEEFWTYPNGYGDCEDYVLAKRRELINAGWPASALLITVVRQANGEGHAVLLVRTDRGDLVLDNQVGTIDLWNVTPYKYIKRQSQADAGQWVDMIDDRTTIVATTAAIR
ncbi:MAG: transglutaminase [Pelagibacterium sp. SCN 64-44]|nr:MAG: transglutaminase [Pelagibacterium sp. SCN 64-44]